MFQTAEHAAHIARPVVAALSGFDTVVGIVCFGSYALGTADAASDVDLYVVCEPTILPERSRRSAFEQVTRVSEVHVPYATPGWDNAWAPQGDRLKVENVAFDLSYQTQSWITHVMRGVLTEGALSLPEMTFRPYTLCGLFADAVPLYDPRWLVQKLKTQLTPYPFVLKRRLIEKAMPVMKDGLTELQDYARRDIGPGAFLFHLGRVCDAMESLLYAVNERYDPATKRGERELAKLAVIPDRFAERFVGIMEGPFDRSGRQAVVNELTCLVREVMHLAQQALG